MKFTMSWLRDHLETEASVADIAEYCAWPPVSKA